MARKRKKKPYRKYWLPCFLSGVVLLAGGGIGLLMGATYLNVWLIVLFVLGGLAMVFTLVALFHDGEWTEGYSTADSMTGI
ncbi:hypothetical protein [Brevibacterium casei]|uniref:Uncharacterized protein n=1 Tax=Brevibacterium casei TaxID=33889 RepID=A0AB34XNR3_9MICO|nr:hypothetical protein [Brevibacterium casei]KZE15968.1 hypothetical protein AVW13_15250 [Brevibacterium casei]